MQDPERPQRKIPESKEEILEEWADCSTDRYRDLCSEQEELEKRLSELEPEKTRILQWYRTSGVNIEANVHELDRCLTLSTQESKIAGEVKSWLQRPRRRPKESIPDLAEKFPIELGDLPSVGTLIAIQRIERRKAELQEKKKVLEVRLRHAGFPIPTEELGSRSPGEKFNPREYGGVELCLIVSYQKAGRRDLRKLAQALKNKAHIRYSGERYTTKDPFDWYEADKKGFTNYISRMRRKAKCKGWYRDIPADYYEKYT